MALFFKWPSPKRNLNSDPAPKYSGPPPPINNDWSLTQSITSRRKFSAYAQNVPQKALAMELPWPNTPRGAKTTF